MKKIPYLKRNKGFTLIETLIAILILAMAIGALLTLTAGGFFTIRYSKNEIVAANLLQESLEYIRNDRDTAAKNLVSWQSWLQTYKDKGCFDSNGCIINPYSVDSSNRVVACDSECEYIHFFPESGFYGYNTQNFFDISGQDIFETSFVRKITMRMPIGQVNESTDVVIVSNMEWMNGTNKKTTSQTLTLTTWKME